MTDLSRFEDPEYLDEIVQIAIDNGWIKEVPIQFTEEDTLFFQEAWERDGVEGIPAELAVQEAALLIRENYDEPPDTVLDFDEDGFCIEEGEELVRFFGRILHYDKDYRRILTDMILKGEKYREESGTHFCARPIGGKIYRIIVNGETWIFSRAKYLKWKETK